MAAPYIVAMRYALVLALASCGRLGFTDLTGDSGNGGPFSTIKVVLSTDEYGLVMPGLPLSGATVLVDRGTGVFDRLTTDEQGLATLAADGVVAFHVVYGGYTAWRIYTVATGTTGTIALGGTPVAHYNSQPMTFVLPNGPGKLFTVHVPGQCATPSQRSVPTLSFYYNRVCEGRTVRAIGYNTTNGSTDTRYVDAGAVTLADGSSFTVTGSYAALSSHTIEVDNMPVGTTFVSADVLERSQVDLTRLAYNSASAIAVTSTTATVTTSTSPGGNTLRVLTYTNAPGSYNSWSERIAPANVSSLVQFDASAMVPPFTSIDAYNVPRLTWSGGGTAGTITVASIIAGPVQWDAYLAPTATSLEFPVLPSDLGVPMPTQFDQVDIIKFDIPQATTAAIAQSIDQSWRRWPYDATLLPDAGSGLARIQTFYGAFR